MASQKQHRRWFSLSSFNRPAPAQPPVPRPPAPTQTYQQPVTGPQVVQIKAPSPSPTPPKETAPVISSGPVRAPNAASPAASATLCITSSSPSATPMRKASATNKYIGKNGEGKDVHKKPFDPEKFRKGIITLIGENEGAIMKLNTSRKNGNEEERSNINGKSRKIMEMLSQPTMVSINSNVQGVNNSVV